MTITGESTGPHMWNIIKLDEKYYYYDSTYAASIKDKNSKHYYGGLMQEEMNYYIPDYPEWYPVIEKETGLLEVSK
jgi:transglutaminase/protease-like cytokinesis protein 3